MEESTERKYIPGTGRAYSCDKEGNIYSHYLPGGNRISKTPQRKIVPFSGTTSKYLQVGISLDGKSKKYLVHRLVAMTWLENPNNYEEVDHIDRNIENNRVENLRWCSRKMNVSYQDVDKGALNGLRSFCRLYKASDNSLVGQFPSITMASQYASENFGCSKSGMAKYHKSKGYYIIAENDEKRAIASRKTKSKWELFSPDGISLGIFPSKSEAGRYIKENFRDISVKKFSDRGKAYGYFVVEKSVETN